MQSWRDKAAIVTGGSAGLGLHLAEALVRLGMKVAIVGRDNDRLQMAVEGLSKHGTVLPIQGDITEERVIAQAVARTQDELGPLKLACHSAGRSMRGELLKTTRHDFESLWQINTLAAFELAKAAAAPLAESEGHLVLIGSLATAVAPRFLGAYPSSKFPLAALAQQLRLEEGPKGLHTLLVMPGPITRDDSGKRYESQSDELPEELKRPGGGAKVKSIDPTWLSQQIIEACERRKTELIIPGKARWLFAINRLSSSWGDWLLRKNTG